MSEFVGNALRALTGGQQPNAIMNMVQQMVQSNGGVQGLVSRFSNAGYNDHVQSWVQSDPVPLTGKQIDDVFTSEEINHFASQLGINPDKMKAVLAETIPHVVDHLTPNQQMPSENASHDWEGLVSRWFAKG